MHDSVFNIKKTFIRRHLDVKPYGRYGSKGKTGGGGIMPFCKQDETVFPKGLLRID